MDIFLEQVEGKRTRKNYIDADLSKYTTYKVELVKGKNYNLS